MLAIEILKSKVNYIEEQLRLHKELLTWQQETWQQEWINKNKNVDYYMLQVKRTANLVEEYELQLNDLLKAIDILQMGQRKFVIKKAWLLDEHKNEIAELVFLDPNEVFKDFVEKEKITGGVGMKGVISNE